MRWSRDGRALHLDMEFGGHRLAHTREVRVKSDFLEMWVSGEEAGWLYARPGKEFVPPEGR